MGPTPSFQIFSNSSPPLFPVNSDPHHLLLFLKQNGWSRHVWFAILLNDAMDLHMSSLGTLVPEGP